MAAAAQPQALNALSQLRGSECFVAWKYELRDGRQTKVPINPHTGARAKIDTPSTWGSYEDARAGVVLHDLAGIGYVFGDSEPFSGIDLDHCRNPETGDIKPWAQSIIDRLGSYTEISPSRTGVKIWVQAKLPVGSRCKLHIEDGAIEVYSRARFFTLTQKHLEGTPNVIEARQEELQQIHSELFGQPNVKTSPVCPEQPTATSAQAPIRGEAAAPPRSWGLNLGDAEVIEKARSARNGDKFSRLFFLGDTSEHSSDDSAADLALVNILAFWVGNPASIDRLFRQSKLWRPKWDQRHAADGRTYGQMTIDRALQCRTDFYSREYDASVSNGAGDGDSNARNAPPTETRDDRGDETSGGADARTESAGENDAAASDPDQAAQRSGPESQASKLLRLAQGIELFHTSDGKPYASFEVNGHVETYAVAARNFKLYLQRRFYEHNRTAISSKALTDAIGVLEARARFDGAEQAVFTRVGERDGAMYIDLGDKRWQCIEVTGHGWRVAERGPVKFRRSAGLTPLPFPITGECALARFPDLLNVASQADFDLIVAWLMGALRPTGPYTLLSLCSEQGSSKSTTSRMIRRAIDPSTAPIRSLPRDERDLLIAATNSRVLAFDNISQLADWVPDALCRILTGGGFTTRELYTDDQEIILNVQRPVIVNGIDELIQRNDLADRTIRLELPPIGADNRLPEDVLWARYDELHPALLGALLDGLSSALRNIGRTDVGTLPRMADFALWVEAAAPGLGWEPGRFATVYNRNRLDVTSASVSSSAFARSILGFKDWTHDSWSGTATELLMAINERASEQERGDRRWPDSAQQVAALLRRLATNLRELGVDVLFERASSARRDRIIRLGGVR